MGDTPQKACTGDYECDNKKTPTNTKEITINDGINNGINDGIANYQLSAMQDCAMFLSHNETRNVMMESSTYDVQMHAMEEHF